MADFLLTRHPLLWPSNRYLYSSENTEVFQLYTEEFVLLMVFSEVIPFQTVHFNVCIFLIQC